MSVVAELDQDELTANRINWIRELREGNRKQGSDSLIDEWDGYCCIGVACSIKGTTDEELGCGYDSSYDLFCEWYGVEPKLKQYLIAMNDGTRVTVNTDGSFVGDYCINGKLIRTKNAPSRDFKFIARFLEVAWGLTP